MTGGISEVYGKLDGMGLAALVRKGEVSPSEVLEEAISRAEAVNGTLNFLTYKAYDEGRKMAADPALPDGPFKGVPWLVKEIATDWEGLQNTNACPYFKDVVSTSDNEQVRRVKQAGFVLLGKSNSPEAGWALSTEPKMYGPTLNPWDTTRTPGGSSGGSAAAVAARVLPLGEASDGGGSIRTPACHSGLVGLKPARGRITMAPGADFWYGGVTFSASRAQSATRPPSSMPSAARCRAIPTMRSCRTPPIWTRSARIQQPLDRHGHGLSRWLHPCRCGGARGNREHWQTAGEPGPPRHAGDGALRLLAALRLLHADRCRGHRAWFDGSAELVGHPLRQDETENLYWTTIQRGREISAVDHHNDILQLRPCAAISWAAWPPTTHGFAPWCRWWRGRSVTTTCRAIATTTTRTSWGGLRLHPALQRDGAAGISLPLHWTADGVPVGSQLVGRDLDEALLLCLAGQLEQAQPWADRVPPVNAGA